MKRLKDAWRSAKAGGPWRAFNIAISTLLDSTADLHLGIASRGAKKSDQGLYLPSRLIPLKSALTAGLVPRHLKFVDVGCGKGRALVIAAQSGFKKLKGIELDPELLACARRNLERFQNDSQTRAELIHANALEYDIEAGDQIFYLYDPFDEASTAAFFSKVYESWSRHPREIHVLYHNNLAREQNVGHMIFRDWRPARHEYMGNRFFAFSSP